MAKKFRAQNNPNVIQSVKEAAKADTRKPAVASPLAGETAAATGAAALVSEAVSSEAAAVEALISEPVTAPSIKAAASGAAEVGALVSEAATPVAAAVTGGEVADVEAVVSETATPVAAAVTGAAAEIELVVSKAPPAPAIEETPPAPAIEHLPRPEEPRYEPPGYIRPALENKYLNKEALRDRLWLRKEFKPIISYVGRLDFQKGVQLIKHGIFYALQQGAQFVLLGTSPEPSINEEFWHLKRQLNDSPDCHLEIGFNEELSHLIYAGSDMIIMPSLYEPCGLTQMIALKYGTVPIVRAVGGLVDTVFDRDYSDRPWEQRNGYVFHQPDAAGLESAMLRAIGLWYSYPDEFQRLVINGMKCDYSWNYPGQHYLNIYEHIRCR